MQPVLFLALPIVTQDVLVPSAVQAVGGARFITIVAAICYFAEALRRAYLYTSHFARVF